MYVLIEVNHDGSFESCALVLASDDRNELVGRMAQRYCDAISGPFDWLRPMSELDGPFNQFNTDDGYASLGGDGSGELIEWFIFNTDDRNTTC